MVYKIDYLPSARADMRGIKEYFAAKSLPGYEKVAALIKAKIVKVAKMPKISAVCVFDPRFRQTVAGSYLVFYTIDEEKRRIEIHHIWHSMRNIEHELQLLREQQQGPL